MKANSKLSDKTKVTLCIFCSGKTVSHYFNNVKEVDKDVMTQLRSLPRWISKLNLMSQFGRLFLTVGGKFVKLLKSDHISYRQLLWSQEISGRRLEQHAIRYSSRVQLWVVLVLVWTFFRLISEAAEGTWVMNQHFHLLSGRMRSLQSPFCPFYKLHVYLYLLVWLLSSLSFRVIGCMKFGSLVMLSLSWLSVSDSLMMFVRDRLGQKWRLCVSNLHWDKTIMLFPLHVWEETAIIFIFA